MTNHPNRGQRGPLANPLPAEIIATRKAAGLTQTEAASLVCGSLRAWQQWEAGDRRMHPGLWMLFRLRTEEAASDPARRAKAEAIGAGNVAKGIRAALDAYQAASLPDTTSSE